MNAAITRSQSLEAAGYPTVGPDFEFEDKPFGPSPRQSAIPGIAPRSFVYTCVPHRLRAIRPCLSLQWN